ncbi:MAG: hypothetical protein D6755_02095 [Anaerolineae bacterium]|nr:MAG: hypothetical protein D6755_02095 [Anaerolineae bacterium]
MLISALRTLNQLLTAGVAITAVSLWLYVLTFNLQDRVARSFAFILACVATVFAGEAMASVGTTSASIAFWLRFEWVGLIFLPASYFYASDALLETTGRPSRGRRRLLVRVNYVVAVFFLALLPLDWLITTRLQSTAPAPALQPAILTPLFVLYYGVMIGWAAANFWRAYRRTYTRTSRRRMMYLMAGATAPALGSFPYLLLGAGWAHRFPAFFWGLAVFSNIFMSAFLVVMAYALAFFGVTWPDRVVKRRLFRWILRGPVTASTVLAVATLTRRIGEQYGVPYNAAVPVLMVASILALEYAITLFAPFWERWLFGYEGRSIRLVKDLEDRLLSEEDLRQFLEAILAAVCERLRSPRGFIASLESSGLQRVISVGRWYANQDSLPDADLLQAVVQENASTGELFTWGDFWLIPLFAKDEEMLMGLMVVARPLGAPHPDSEQRAALRILSQRAALGLQDHRLQQQVVESLSALRPQVDVIQRLRAASRYGSRQVLSSPQLPLEGATLNKWVKDALSHFWGGPKLTESPLLQLQIVQQAVAQGENPVNALREILRKAIEEVRPPGERRFTAEWILYNILEMKFMEGRKVREIAMRLAMSEADFYRKQRIAIEEVARVMMEMEKQQRSQATQSSLPQEKQNMLN